MTSRPATGRPERIAETGIDPGWLPEVQPNAAPIGPILPAVAAELGLPRDLLVVTGAYDTYAAAVGSAAVDPGLMSLSCGTLALLQHGRCARAGRWSWSTTA